MNIDRFMGHWYVIAAVPTPIDRNAFNATMTYRRDVHGSIATTYRFRNKRFDGRHRILRPRGEVGDGPSNERWAMRFIWPVRSDIRILFVDDDYAQAIIGRDKRDYAWILARTPDISHQDFFERVRLIRDAGYDTRRLRMVPHRSEAAQYLDELRSPALAY